jgi:nicotinate-nucleotide pyrophosphorylase (carboxylating)
MTARAQAPDIARLLFRDVKGLYRAVVETTEAGRIAGLGFVDPALAPAEAGTWRVLVDEGAQVEPGAALVEVIGKAHELGIAEDYVLGPTGFASGIATRAAAFRAAAPEGLSLACGGWKKLPAALKPMLRAGLAAAGLLPRLVEGDFVYMSKNAVTLLGDVEAAIAAGLKVGHGPVAVQVKSVDEAMFAYGAGGRIIMVDTGVISDLAAVHRALTEAGQRDEVHLAFGGGVRLKDLADVRTAGANAADIGRAILDAPLLDLRLRVIGEC